MLSYVRTGRQICGQCVAASVRLSHTTWERLRAVKLRQVDYAAMDSSRGRLCCYGRWSRVQLVGLAYVMKQLVVLAYLHEAVGCSRVLA